MISKVDVPPICIHALGVVAKPDGNIRPVAIRPVFLSIPTAVLQYIVFIIYPLTMLLKFSNPVITCQQSILNQPIVLSKFTQTTENMLGLSGNQMGLSVILQTIVYALVSVRALRTSTKSRISQPPTRVKHLVYLLSNIWTIFYVLIELKTFAPSGKSVSLTPCIMQGSIFHGEKYRPRHRSLPSSVLRLIPSRWNFGYPQGSSINQLVF